MWERILHIYIYMTEDKYLDYAKNSKKKDEPIKDIWARNLTREFFLQKKYKSL